MTADSLREALEPWLHHRPVFPRGPGRPGDPCPAVEGGVCSCGLVAVSTALLTPTLTEEDVKAIRDAAVYLRHVEMLVMAEALHELAVRLSESGEQP